MLDYKTPSPRSPSSPVRRRNSSPSLPPPPADVARVTRKHPRCPRDATRPRRGPRDFTALSPSPPPAMTLTPSQPSPHATGKPSPPSSLPQRTGAIASTASTPTANAYAPSTTSPRDALALLRPVREPRPGRHRRPTLCSSKLASFPVFTSPRYVTANQKQCGAPSPRAPPGCSSRHIS